MPRKTSSVIKKRKTFGQIKTKAANREISFLSGGGAIRFRPREERKPSRPLQYAIKRKAPKTRNQV